MTVRILALIGGTLAAWVLIALPARALCEPDVAADVATFSGTAFALCLAPAILTLWWGRSALRKSPEIQLVAILGGNGIRMFGVLLAAWGLTQLVASYDDFAFWCWLLVAYMITLALEITLLLVGNAPAETMAKEMPTQASASLS